MHSVISPPAIDASANYALQYLLLVLRVMTGSMSSHTNENTCMDTHPSLDEHVYDSDIVGYDSASGFIGQISCLALHIPAA